MSGNVLVEQQAGEVRISLKAGSSPLPTATKIFLVTVMGGLPSDEGAGFQFDARTLGQKGLFALREHFEQLGYTIEFDGALRSEIAERKQRQAVLQAARATGLQLKETPSDSFRVPGLKRGLKQFQRPAVAHMVAVTHAANFSVPGSGKTAITLAAYLHLKQQGQVNKLVVIGPRSAFAPWEAEYAEVMPHPGRIVRITGNPRQRQRKWRAAERADLALLNYHTAPNDFTHLENFLSDFEVMLVLDESHYIKSIGDGRWTTTLQALAPLAKKRVILTGTPAPNSLADLWSQLNFLYPDLDVLGTRDRFRFRVDRRGAQIDQEVGRRLKPLFWRVRKRDLKLPKPIVRRIHVQLRGIQKDIYTALATRLLRDVTKAPADSARLRLWRRAKMIRLLQAASNPVLLAKQSVEFKLPPLSAAGLGLGQLIDRYHEFEVPAKIKLAVELAREIIGAGRKVIIWTSFVHNIRMLERTLRDVRPLLLYGAIPATAADDSEVNRERTITLFKDLTSGHQVLIANPAACAESISLHMACHDAVYLDRTFNCAHFIQSKDRIHRVGLDPAAKIRYYYLIAKDTIDEVVDQRLEEKQARMLKLLEEDFGPVDLESAETVVSEEAEEIVDFAETLKHLTVLGRHDQQPK